MPLSDAACRAAKPAEKPYKISDGGGLHLLVEKNGSRLWRQAYRFDGKQKVMALGAYPSVSLADARGARDKNKALLAKGVDPSVQRRLDRGYARRVRASRESQLASGRYRSVDATTMHERLRDTAMSTRSVDRALELSDVIAQGTTVLQSLKGKHQAIEEGRKFFSALDVLGKNIDPKEVKELFDGYIKALGVEGADMDLGRALTFARQSRAPGGILSNRFLMTTAPGLARDLGDPQLGTALASSLSQNIGGRATKASKAAQQEYGLRDRSGNFVDSRRAMSDRDRWAWETLIPDLQKKGVDVNDDVKVSEVLSKLFSNRVVGDVFSKLITQREQYQAKAEQYGRAPGLSAAGMLPGKDHLLPMKRRRRSSATSRLPWTVLPALQRKQPAD
jgi:Arm domain-containing DNA-binding protein